MCSSCNGDMFETDYDSAICTHCGIETSVPLKITNPNSNTYNTHTPFLIGYSRKKRFTTMLDNVFYPNATSADDDIMKFLFQHKPIKNLDEVCRLLKSTKCKDKRYCSLHLWARLCIPGYKPPQVPPDYIRKRILFKFQELEFLHKRYTKNRPFFNYCWLLRKFLYQMDCYNFIRYVKKLKCAKRRKFYQTMFAELISHLRKDAPI